MKALRATRGRLPRFVINTLIMNGASWGGQRRQAKRGQNSTRTHTARVNHMTNTSHGTYSTTRHHLVLGSLRHTEKLVYASYNFECRDISAAFLCYMKGERDDNDDI